MEQSDADDIAKQAISEIYHCVEAGPSWFTKGERGQMDHARMWTDRATKAISRLTAERDQLRDALQLVWDTYGMDPSVDSAIWQTVRAALGIKQ